MFSPPPVNKKPAEEKHRHTMLSASKASPNKSAGEEDPPFRPSVLSIRRINVRWVAHSLNTFRTAFNTNGQILHYDKLNTLRWQVNSHCCYTFRSLSRYSIESWGGHKLTKSIERLFEHELWESRYQQHLWSGLLHLTLLIGGLRLDTGTNLLA